jgi:O-antigen/teichoic acid export membrane protein
LGKNGTLIVTFPEQRLMTTDRSVVSRFLSVFSAKMATVAITVVVTPALVRLLGSEGYGEYAFAIAALGVVMLTANAGIYDGVRKFIAEDRDREAWEAHVFGFYARLAAAIATIAAALLAALSVSGVVRHLFGPPFERYFLLIASLVVVRQFFQTTRGALMGVGLERYSESFVVGRKVMFAVVGLSLAAIGWGVSGVLIGHLIANALTCLGALVVLAGYVDLGAILRRVPSDFPRRQLATFNLESVVLISLTASLYHVDILLLQPLGGSQETGYYRAALLVAEFLWFVPFALQTVLLHSSSTLWSREEYDRISALAARATRYTLVLTVLLALGIAALADPFVRLYFGSEFTVASTAILLLLPGALGFAVARPVFAIGQGSGRLRLLIAATGTAALLNLVLNLLLIPRYGMFGAAIATSVGYGSMLALHVAAARAIGFRPLSGAQPLRFAAVVLIVAPVIFGLARLVSGPLSLVVVPPVGGMVYTAVILRTGVITVEEIETALDTLPPKLAGHLRTVVVWIAGRDSVSR